VVLLNVVIFEIRRDGEAVPHALDGHRAVVRRGRLVLRHGTLDGTLLLGGGDARQHGQREPHRQRAGNNASRH
jgi:hypothetical protein